MKLITGTAPQENFVCTIRFGISGLDGFQGVLVEVRALDKKAGSEEDRE
jgi:hypothetical protein